MSGELVPFGRYQGKPLEALIEDRSYVEWLVAQDWFRNKYPTHYSIIINNFGEPQDTPDHNIMQSRFLDDNLLAAISQLVLGTISRPTIRAKRFEVEGWDVQFKAEVTEYSYVDKTKNQSRKAGKDYVFTSGRTIQNSLEMIDLGLLSPLESDVQVHKNASSGGEYCIYDRFGYTPPIRGPHCTGFSEIEYYSPDWLGRFREYSTNFAVELKPSLGDDYPSVLRKGLAAVKNEKVFVAVAGFFSAAVPLAIAQQMFRHSGAFLLEMSVIEEHALNFTPGQYVPLVQ